MEQTIYEAIETLEKKLGPGSTSEEINDAAQQVLDTAGHVPLTDPQKAALSAIIKSAESMSIVTDPWFKLKQLCGLR